MHVKQPVPLYITTNRKWDTTLTKLQVKSCDAINNLTVVLGILNSHKLHIIHMTMTTNNLLLRA